MMTKTILTEAEWANLAMDLPFGISKEAARREKTAVVEPGCAVKTRDEKPQDFGKLLHFSQDKVVVLCWADRVMLHPEGKLCKWTGTAAQYEEMWRCD
jgi:hypothetical protein